MRGIVGLFVGVLSILNATKTTAQSFPNAPVTIIVPFNAGASSDIFARYIAQELGQLWDQPVMVENMPGAGGSIGTNHVVKSEPTGHTILFLTSTYTTNAAAQSNLPFDPRKDIQPIMKYADGDLIMVSGPRVEINNLEDLIREAGKQTIFYGSTGPASTPTFLAKMMSEVTSIPLEAVAFTGGSLAMLDVIAGRVDIYIGTVTTVLSSVESGALKGVAVFGEERSKSLPDVPTVAELGYPEATTSFWFGIFGPVGIEGAVLEKINRDITSIMEQPKTVELFASQGATPAPSSTEAFSSLIDAELDKWSDLAQRYGIRSE